LNLLRCHIHGFGKLADLSLRFDSGLNIVFAGNEAGKTTLQRFLVALLYGQLRADLRTHRRLDPWVAQYKPWHASEYGGILWCRLKNGRELELRRSFGKEEAGFQIRTSAGEDITSQYEQQRNGDVLFARSHVGLPKELFESVAVIRENKLAELNGRDSIRDRIANLAQSGDEELSVRQSLSKLEEALEGIGSERAPTKPYKQTLDLVESLKAERKALEQRREEFQNWIDERARLVAEVARLERESAQAARMALSARLRETAAKVRALEEIEQELAALQLELEAVHGNPSFPAHRLDSLSRLVAFREGIEKQLADIRTEAGGAAELAARTEKELNGLSHYGELDASVESEKRITDWFVGYLSLSVQKDAAQRSCSTLNEDLAALNRTLEANPAFSQSDIDWEKKARETAEEERQATQSAAEFGARISEQESLLAAARRKKLRTRVFAEAAVLVLCATFAIRFTLPSAALPWQAVFALTIACVALTAASLQLSFKAGARARTIQDSISHMEEGRAKVLQDGGSSQKLIRQAMAHSGFADIDSFLAAARKYQMVRQRAADVSARLQAAQQQREKIEGESTQIYARLKDSLATVGLSCSPGNMKAQIDLLRSNLRRYRELAFRCRDLNERLSALRSKEQELVEEAATTDYQIRDILADGGVESPEAFRDACRRRQRTLELQDRKASRAREYQRLCGSMTLEDWKGQLQQLSEREQSSGRPEPESADPACQPIGAKSPDGAPLLPYCPTSEEAEHEERRVAALLSAERQELAKLGERVNNAFQNCREMSEIDEDLALAERTLLELGRNRDALALALEMLHALSREQQEVLAPQLNRAVERRFLRLCQKRYEEVKIDPDLRLLVRESGTAELRNAEQLSHGAQDQLYFSLRFGILDLVSNDEEDCPCFLDEPFAAYDRCRMIEALSILRDESERRQLLVFTCREDLLELARQDHATIITL